ncbi:MAG: hypothetical protein EBR02_05915 [Alphaproteobacteria bacterium]|nr:hypothetical protein [Alphaproteobacteria bacterium]
MDNSLLDKDKKPEAEVQKPADGGALSASAAPAPDKEPELSLEKWEKDKLPWRDTVGGRAAIRLFSRGLLGAAFFAWGGKYARNAIDGDKAMGMHGYSFDFAKGAENHWNFAQDIKSPLKLIARGVDKFVATPIKWATKTIGFSEEKAERLVRFRPMSVKFRNTGESSIKHGGRSLGEETIGITFDFLCASVGDALGRDIADSLDKNVKKDWLDNKGHINVEKAAKTAGKNLWRYLSYNGGEDWAVAIPYAYYMKGQRRLLNRINPGAKLDINENNNGAAFKIDVADGKSKIVGNYNATGVYDLQSRFTVYNMGTLLYREAYDWVGNMLSGHPTHLYGAPDAPDKHKTIVEKAEDVAKWVTRGVVKGFIYMTPATPFFWITRTPQTAYKGTFIHPETEAMLGYKTGGFYKDDGTPEFKLIKYEGLEKGSFTKDTPVYLRHFTGKIDKIKSPRGWETLGSPSVHLNPFHDGKFDYGRSRGGAAADWLAPFGRMSDAYRKKVVKLGGRFGFSGADASRFASATVAYTPYMFMKAETARAWDTGKMDLAAERMIDGAFKWDAKEFKAGAKEVWNTILQKPLDDAEREKEGQRRIQVDTSAADADLTSSAEDHKIMQQKAAAKQQAQQPVSFTTNSSTSMGAAKHVDGLSWKERAVQGRAPSQKRDPLEAMARPQLSHADRQEMREFLAQAVPPTNSKH